MKGERAIHKRVQLYSYTEVNTLYRDFQICENGYDREKVEENRRLYGSNLLDGRAKDTILYRLRRAFINPFTIILFVLAVISFITDVLFASNFSRNISTVLIILCMLLISGILRFIQEMKSKRIADRLTSLLHSDVTARRDGQWKEIASANLVVGDTVRLFPGDRVPADIRLTKANDLFLSQSVITGESAILEKNADILSIEEPASYNEYNNIAFMGSAVTGGTGEGVVLAVGQDTVYGGFSGFAGTGLNKKNRFAQGANSIAWVLIRFATVLIPIVFVACGLTKGSWFAAFLFALSVAVGLIPEMLTVVINACLSKGSSAMRQKQTVVKNINAMQGFGSMDILCVDKTGTLTEDTVLLEYYMDILGNESEKVLDYAYLNSLYHTGIANHLDSAILRCQEIAGLKNHFRELVMQHPKIDEQPFDYERKIVSILVKDDDKNLLIVKGSVENICCRCSFAEYREMRSPINPDNLSSVHAIVDDMLEDGMKVLAVAYKPVSADQLNLEEEKDFILIGYLAFFDAPKKTASSAIQKLKDFHVNIKVLTGDQKEVAVSICRRLEIDTKQVLTGKELENLSDDEKMICIENTAVFSELSPRQKAEIVQTLQTNGHTVGFLGDGMNDLPAIVESDVGISVDTAVEAVEEGADVILLKKDLNVLGEGILEGRKAFSNMSKYIRITASSNFGNILSIVVASIFLPFFPMTFIQLLLLNLLYDTICLALPWDNVDKDTCSVPLEWSGRTLGRFMRYFGPISSIFDMVTFAFLFFVFCPAMCGGSFFSLTTADTQTKFIAFFQTGWFLESMWTQILILYMLRTKKIPFLQSRPSAIVIVITMFGGLLFTVLTFTSVGQLIGLTALPFNYFGFLAIVVVLYLLLMTLMKRWYIKKYHELL